MKTSHKGDVVNELINNCIENEDWDELIEIATKDLEKNPDSHWLLTMMASAYYEKREYVTAYEYIAQAMTLAPDCPMIFWHLASILRMQNKQEEAITVWEEIIKRGEGMEVYDDCWEDEQWAKSLINDSKYMIGTTYLDQGEVDEAKRFIEAYHQNVDKGVESIYDPNTLSLPS